MVVVLGGDSSREFSGSVENVEAAVIPDEHVRLYACYDAIAQVCPVESYTMCVVACSKGRCSVR